MAKKDISRENEILLREEIKRLNTMLSEANEKSSADLEKLKSSNQQLQHDFMKYKAESVQQITQLKLQQAIKPQTVS